MRSSAFKWRWLSRLAGRRPADAVILAYHRVAEPPRDPFELAVAPSRFAEQLEVLRARANPISLQELVEAIWRGAVPRRAVVVTFDDGYADNLDAALPALEREGLAATFFIASGHIGSSRGFWWDELGDILLTPGILPARIDMRLGGEVVHQDLGATASLDADQAERLGRWRYRDEFAPSPRHRLYRRLYPILQRMAPDPQVEAMDSLRSWAGVEPSARIADRTMTEEEFLQFTASSLVQIGGHTHHHVMLSALPADIQRRELTSGKIWLEERIGRRLDHLSYPYGQWSSETAAIVRQVGFAAACTTEAAGITPPANPFGLPRICPGDWDGEQFATLLDRWFGA